VRISSIVILVFILASIAVLKSMASGVAGLGEVPDVSLVDTLRLLASDLIDVSEMVEFVLDSERIESLSLFDFEFILA
jgi:hypothetical protein